MKKIITLAAMLAVAACGQPAGWTPPQGATRASFGNSKSDSLGWCRRSGNSSM